MKNVNNLLKRFAVMSVMALSFVAFSGSANAEAENVAVRKMICGDVTWDCGATGRICGDGVQGVIDRYNEANPC